MGYLICEKCGGYYELQKGESLSDFDCCQCGGKLKYYEDSVQGKTEDNNYNHKLKKHDEIKKIIDNNIDFNKNSELKKCLSCGTLNSSESKFCSKCNSSLLSLKEKKELNNKYLQENKYLQNNDDKDLLKVEIHRENNLTFTSVLGANRFSYRENGYAFVILFLLVIPIVLSKLGTSMQILTPLFVFLFILFVSIIFNESTELEDVMIETIFFSFVFAIPGFIFILIPLSNIFGYVIALILYMGCILSILAAQLTGIIIKNLYLIR